MDKNPIVLQTKRGFKLGIQFKGEKQPRWGWSLTHQMLAELWLLGIKAYPAPTSDSKNLNNFGVFIYADTHAEAWYCWENKLAPWLLGIEIAEKPGGAA